MKAYKLISKLKSGQLRPLFIGKTITDYTPGNGWLQAMDVPTKGYAHRPGFHCLFQPVAPHLKQGDNRTWVKVEIEDYEVFERPESQGGKWLLAQKMRVLKEIII